MCSGKGRQGITPARFPHSDIPGSKSACDSPRLIAACHVLHRLLVPRHPPHALISLAKKFAPDRQHPVQPSQNLAIKRAQYKCSAKKLLDYSVVKEPAGVRQRRIQPAVDSQRGWPSTSGLIRTPIVPSCFAELVENTGLEPVTSGLQSRRSPN